MLSLPSVSLLLVGSGFAALIYQIAWLRELRLVFGASTAASAAVLAVFMGGLGWGGLRLGRRAARHPRPLALYAQLELGVALAAAATPFLVDGARWLYLAAGGSLRLGLFGGTVARLILAALVLGLPTFLMGGTLPAAAQAVERPGDEGRRRLAALYGANTLGAVTGAALGTFLLLEVLGTRRMLWSGALINALVALVARAMARRAAAPAPAPAAPEAPVARPPGWLVLWAAALAGFAFLLMELVWYRTLAPLLGGSSFTFGLILAVALLGIGLGGVVYALFGARLRPTVGLFALSCAVEALALSFPFALGDRVAFLAALLRPLGALGFSGQVLGWTAVTALVVLPAAFVSGLQFPLLLALLGRGDDEVGRHVGVAYACNTAGAIAGSLAGGFGLLPLVGAVGAWRAVVLLLALLAAGAVVVALRRDERRATAWGAAAAATVAALLLLAEGPSAAWRHGGIGAGRGPKEGTPNKLRLWQNAIRRAIAWEAEGVESSVALDREVGLAFVVNGKIDGNARSDAPTQVMSGLLGALLHPEVKRAMVIGLGTGSTAGWLGVVPGIERVDVAELEPSIRTVAERCAAVNHDVMKNPKVKLFLGDAREMLLASRDNYDLIFSEPSNPYRAGIASLFTREFYRAVRGRLAPGGLFLQWVQAYSVDAQTVRTVYATLAAEFPAVETWVTQEADLLLVASLQPQVHDVAAMQKKIAQAPYRAALRDIWRVDDVAGVFAHYLASDRLTRAVAAAEGDNLNTDDETLVEMGFARGLGLRDSLFSTQELRLTAARLGMDKPALVGALEPALVDERRVSMLAAQESPPALLPVRLDAAATARAVATAAWVRGDLKEAARLWLAAPGGPPAPTDPLQRLVAAESLAEVGDASAEAHLAALAAESPVEAAAIEARLAAARGDVARAAAALGRAFTAYRSDPWPQTVVMNRALNLAVEVARRDRAQAPALEAALAAPFAVHLLDERRENARLELAMLGDFAGRCVAALAPFEAHPPWRREILEVRARCYEKAGHPLAARAKAELARFVAAEPLPFAAGLGQPSR